MGKPPEERKAKKEEPKKEVPLKMANTVARSGKTTFPVEEDQVSTKKTQSRAVKNGRNKSSDPSVGDKSTANLSSSRTTTVVEMAGPHRSVKGKCIVSSHLSPTLKLVLWI